MFVIRLDFLVSVLRSLKCMKVEYITKHTGTVLSKYIDKVYEDRGYAYIICKYPIGADSDFLKIWSCDPLDLSAYSNPQSVGQGDPVGHATHLILVILVRTRTPNQWVRVTQFN